MQALTSTQTSASSEHEVMSHASGEWYVLMHGYGSLWTPVAILLGRTEALVELTQDMPVTTEEARVLKIFHARSCEVGQGVLLVGTVSPKGRTPDRRLVRVKEPRL